MRNVMCHFFACDVIRNVSFRNQAPPEMFDVFCILKNALRTRLTTFSGNIGKVPKNGNPPGFQSFNDRLLNGVLRFTGEVEDEIWILGIGRVMD